MKGGKLLAVLAGVALALLCAASPCRANVITLDFEGIPYFTSLTNEYASEGVTFLNAQVLVAPNYNTDLFPPTSGNGVVLDAPGTPMTIMFDTPTDFFAGSFTYSAMLTFDAYDGDNHLLTTFYSSTGSNLGSHEYLSLNLDGISKITIGGAWWGFSFTMDDMQFNGPQAIAPTTVPAPAALLLGAFGSGIVAFVHRRRRARA